MIPLALVLATALALGMRHAADADHVVAVSTIVSRDGSLGRAMAVGVLWGVGHTLTILIVGASITVFGLALPADFSTAFEACVAFMLVGLGARNLLQHRRRQDASTVVPPFLVGVVHGLAGSAAAVLLVVPLIERPAWAALYLLAFGAGTVIGMTMLTYAIAGSTLYATRRLRGLDRWIRLGAGAASVAFGAALLFNVA